MWTFYPTPKEGGNWIGFNPKKSMQFRASIGLIKTNNYLNKK